MPGERTIKPVRLLARHLTERLKEAGGRVLGVDLISRRAAFRIGNIVTGSGNVVGTKIRNVSWG